MLFIFRWLPSQGLAPLLIIIQNSALSQFRGFREADVLRDVMGRLGLCYFW